MQLYSVLVDGVGDSGFDNGFGCGVDGFGGVVGGIIGCGIFSAGGVDGVGGLGCGCGVAGVYVGGGFADGVAAGIIAGVVGIGVSVGNRLLQRFDHLISGCSLA